MSDVGYYNVYKNRFDLSRLKPGGILIAIKEDVLFSWKFKKIISEFFLFIRKGGK